MSKTERLSEDIDKECADLCSAINSFNGLSTVESCCGHDRQSFRIWFMANNLDCLPDLLYWFDSCHCGFGGWRVCVKTDCAKSPVIFRIEGPTGEQAYKEANSIAALIAKQKEKPDGNKN